MHIVTRQSDGFSRLHGCCPHGVDRRLRNINIIIAGASVQQAYQAAQGCRQCGG